MNRLFCLCGGMLISFLIAGPAAAYIGPGAGLSAIGTVLAVGGAFLLLIVGFVWYPVKRMLRGRKTAARNVPEVESSDQSGSNANTQKRDEDSSG